MDEQIFVYQINGVVCALSGAEPQIYRVFRPECMRNSFQAFHDADGYDFIYGRCGKFHLVYAVSGKVTEFKAEDRIEFLDIHNNWLKGTVYNVNEYRPPDMVYAIDLDNATLSEPIFCGENRLRRL